MATRALRPFRGRAQDKLRAGSELPDKLEWITSMGIAAATCPSRIGAGRMVLVGREGRGLVAKVYQPGWVLTERGHPADPQDRVNRPAFPAPMAKQVLRPLAVLQTLRISLALTTLRTFPLFVLGDGDLKFTSRAFPLKHSRELPRCVDS